MLRIVSIAAVAAATCSAHYTCIDFKLPVTVHNVSTVVSSINLADGFAATGFANSLTRQGAVAPVLPTTNLTKTFNISVKYCTSKGAKTSTLQLLSHGIGFDKSYWDYRPTGSLGNIEYSYVDAALKAGFSTLAWDRLGVGSSTVADPVSEIQSLVELAVFTELTKLVRHGEVPQVPKPNKIVHVGHSYGSQLALALAATNPGLVDGLVLTGFSNLYNSYPDFLASTSLHLANTNQPHRFPASKYSNNFLTWPDVYAFQYSFLAYPYFDPTVAKDVEARKYPFTVGEFLTIRLLPTVADGFTGPVMYLAAGEDEIYCGGNCTNLYNATSPAISAVSASSNVTVVYQPNMGHAINVHYNASGAYSEMLKWVKDSGF